MKKLFGKLYIPLAWTLFIQVLLCLPGSAIPNTGSFFTIPNLDKVVHIIFFGTLVGLWCYYFFSKGTFPRDKLKVTFFIIFLLAAFNGIIIEFIQKDFIPNRSFDQGDIIADILSAAIAYGVCNVKLS